MKRAYYLTTTLDLWPYAQPALEANWPRLSDLVLQDFLRSAPLALAVTPSTSDPRPLRIVFGKEPVDKAFALRLSLGAHAATIRADGIGNFTVE